MKKVTIILLCIFSISCNKKEDFRYPEAFYHEPDTTKNFLIGQIELKLINSNNEIELLKDGIYKEHIKITVMHLDSKRKISYYTFDPQGFIIFDHLPVGEYKIKQILLYKEIDKRMNSIGCDISMNQFSVKETGITNIGKINVQIDAKNNQLEVSQEESYSDIQDAFYATFVKSKWLKSDWRDAKIIW